MTLTAEQQYLIDVMKAFINTPSPVGYYEEVNPLVVQYAKALGYEVTFDFKHTGYIAVPGKNADKTICIGAHLDTLGFMVRTIDADGMIRTRNLGGINYNNVEGESVTVITREGKRYTGMMVCQSHSVHVFDDATTLERNENTMMVLLDERVSSREDVKKLGIEHGDYIYMEPHFTVTPSGYVKSRFIDDKACVACAFSALKYLKENEITPEHNLLFAFPHYEEIGHGGSYIPKEVSEYIALDIAVLGPGYNGSEDQVTICAKDNFSPYDRAVTQKLIDAAKRCGIDYEVDIFYRYGTDAHAAVRGGNNVQSGAFGMGVFCSHGIERTHMDAIDDTVKLLIEYIR